MTSNNQVSSMLLLILIGVAIYFLCYSEAFSEPKHKEFFEDLKLENNNQTDIIGNDTNSMLYSEPLMEPDVSNDVINEIVESEDQQQEEEQPEEEQPEEEPVQMQQPAPKLTQQQMEQPIINQPTVNEFSANDEMSSDFGFELESAFSAPLPPGTNPEVVDFKKVNNDNYNAKDFLPKQINDEWFETDFSLAKYQLNDDKLINTERYMIGINTVGQSLKNATYDIRGTIANPKLVVSPWNNSTYEPDFNLKPLC